MTTLHLNPHLALLQRLIEASGGRSSTRGLIEAAPHLQSDLGAEDCIATLRNLGLPLDFAPGRLSDVTSDDCPALFIGHDGQIALLTGREGNKVQLAEPTCGDAAWHPITAKQGTFLRIDRTKLQTNQAERTDVRKIARGFQNIIGALFFASFFTNLIGLSVPVLIMVIYDRAIPTRAPELLASLALAMALVLATDFALRAIRARAVAHMGSAMEGRLGLELFRKLTALPIAEIRKSDVDQQIARLKQFESMRDLFSGAVFNALLDLPFIIIFIALLFVLSPAIAGLLLAVLAIFALAAIVTSPRLSQLNADASAARAAEQRLMFEMIRQQRHILRLGLGEIWQQRHAACAAATAEASRRARDYQMGCQSFGQMLTGLSGVGAIVLGTSMAMASDLSLGALIAIMSLVWKALSPAHALFASLPQIEGLWRSRQQIDRVLGLPEEFVRGASESDLKSFDGALSLTSVTHRYPKSVDPALTGVSVEIAAGECVAICGADGSGKTTLLDLIDGLYTPLVGNLAIDGVTYRQIAVDELRNAISVVRQDSSLFHGSIRQNFQLACPEIDDHTILQALESLGIAEDIAGLPEGLDTRLNEAVRRKLSSTTLRGLVLARGLSKPAAIYLLDTPASGLDEHRRHRLDAWMQSLKCKKTLLITGNRPEQIRLADRCICLHQGRVVSDDTGPSGQRRALALLGTLEESANA